LAKSLRLHKLFSKSLCHAKFARKNKWLFNPIRAVLAPLWELLLVELLAIKLAEEAVRPLQLCWVFFGGAILGDKIEGAPAQQTQTVQNCTTQNVIENRIIGYNVTYEFNGKQYNIQLPRDPGPTIKLNVTPVMNCVDGLINQFLDVIAFNTIYCRKAFS
jgi:hypothetical protein